MFKIEEKDGQVFTCKVHGEYTGTAFRIVFGDREGDWDATECPTCTAERREREAAEAAKRKEEAAANRERRAAIIAGIPERFREATFDGYATPLPGQARALKIVTRYAEVFEGRRKVGGGLILTGRPGTGKTMLMCALARALMGRWAVRYTDCWEMVGAVKKTFRKSSDEDEEAVIRRYVEPDLLLVDEVGVAYGSDVERAIIHRVLDLRYQAVKPTIVAGNLSIEEMATYLGERALSRLQENGLVVPFDWHDHRASGP